MKRNTSIIGFLAVIIFVLIMSGCQEKEDTPQVSSNEKEQTMTVTSSGIVNGVIEDKYGKRGTEFNENGIPTYSLPLKIENAPEGTVSYALLLEDKDAFPVSGGFSWVHWTAANITKTELKENESQTATDFVQGVNSWLSLQGGSHPAESCSYYGGMAPPDSAHIYDIHVYALDKLLDLENGFHLNQLYRQMRGHILEETTIIGEYAH